MAKPFAVRLWKYPRRIIRQRAHSSSDWFLLFVAAKWDPYPTKVYCENLWEIDSYEKSWKIVIQCVSKFTNKQEKIVFKND